MQQQMHSITISIDVKPTDIIETMTTIIVNQYQIPIVQDIVEFPINQQQNFNLFKQAKQFYMIIQVSDQPTKQQQNSIQKLIALSDKIVCIQLDKQLQSKVQKFYVEVVPELYVRYTSDSKESIQKPSLIFVNQSYRKIYSRQAQGIYYYKTVQQYNANRYLTQVFRNNISSLFSLGTLKIFTELDKKSNKDNQQNEEVKYSNVQFPAITANQFLSIYNNLNFTPKDATQVKYLMLSYRELIYRRHKKLKAELMIFQQGQADINKSVLREISKKNASLNLSKKQMNKLEWKYNRLKIFADLVWEEGINTQLVRKYKKCSLFDMQIQVIILQVQQFYRVWIRNTLQQLKKSFHNIANRRDNKALSEFRTKWHNLTQKLQKCEQQARNLTQKIYSNLDSSTNISNSFNQHIRINAHRNYNLIIKMNKQVQQFINAHQYVLKDEYLSSMKYITYNMKYMWNNQPKIYHKVGFLALILLLAYLQKNIIIGFTLISLGLIFSAINI